VEAMAAREKKRGRRGVCVRFCVNCLYDQTGKKGVWARARRPSSMTASAASMDTRVWTGRGGRWRETLIGESLPDRGPHTESRLFGFTNRKRAPDAYAARSWSGRPSRGWQKKLMELPALPGPAKKVGPIEFSRGIAQSFVDRVVLVTDDSIPMQVTPRKYCGDVLRICQRTGPARRHGRRCFREAGCAWSPCRGGSVSAWWSAAGQPLQRAGDVKFQRVPH